MKLRLAALLTLTLLSACRSRGDVLDTGGVYEVRSACPVAGVPAGTGDVTLFNPPTSNDSRAIDVTAAISDVRAVCQDVGNDVVSTVTFTITALRRDAGPARQVILPYFNVALQGNNRIAAKAVGNAALNFKPGEVQSWTRVQSTVRINRGVATLPENVRRILTQERKPGDYPLTAESLANPAIAHGQLLGPFEFQSKIFKGTVRRYWIYVPVGYDAAKPANLLVFQDGQRASNPNGSLRVQNVLDNLIAKGDIPPTIGVFITPGNLSEHYPDNLGMSNPDNRANEYDALVPCRARSRQDDL